MPMYRCDVMVSMSYSVLLEAESEDHARVLAGDMVDDLDGVTASADVEVDVAEVVMDGLTQF